MPWPEVAIIILNWNNAPDTIECLKSVGRLDYPNYCVLVVDNGSRDTSVALITTHFPQVEILRNSQNLGYAGGNNVGIRRALHMGAEWVLILNNDAIVARDCLIELVQATRCFPRGGALGPVVYQADSLDEIQAAGGHFSSGLKYSWHGGGETSTGLFGRVHEVDLLPGCALLLSRRALEQVGLFDERFFMYREDIDLCLRLSTAGYGLYLVPSAHVWHRRPSLGKQIPPHVVYYMTRNSLLLVNKLGQPAEMLRFLWQDITAYILWKLSPRWQGMQPQAAARLDGVKDYLLGRLGRSDKWSPTKG